MEYNFREIEKKWQQRWVENKTYRVTEDESKKKFYVLNMFPYPSGAGLHVGHPLGYIASDIYARYKRLQGFNVLNPMGYDAYGLPAEQYAIQTGQHPAKFQQFFILLSVQMKFLSAKGQLFLPYLLHRKTLMGLQLLAVAAVYAVYRPLFGLRIRGQRKSTCIKLQIVIKLS